MHSVSVKNLPEAWINVLREIHINGQVNKTEYSYAGRDVRSRYLNGVSIELSEYFESWNKLDPWCSLNRIAAYKGQFARDVSTGHDYTYMDRLTKYPVTFNPATGKWDTLDQIAKVVEQLQKGKAESKRLNLITWHPMFDIESEHPPCLQSIWLYPYPDRTMDVHIRYRSWDWFQAAEGNIIAILDMVDREILDPCRYDLRTFRAYGDNVHYYMENEDEVKRVLAASLR